MDSELAEGIEAVSDYLACSCYTRARLRWVVTTARLQAVAEVGGPGVDLERLQSLSTACSTAVNWHGLSRRPAAAHGGFQHNYARRDAYGLEVCGGVWGCRRGRRSPRR
jgi:hypothetical protein